MSNPIVSIITPSYNRADIVHETAESIFNQTYPDWEWVIVDDGSTDNSWEVLQKYTEQDSRVKLYKRKGEQKGACVCRNQAVDVCNGKYLIFLDTDDILEPFCVENRVKTMEENPELDFGIYPSLLFSHQRHDLNLWWNIDKPTPELLRQFYQDAICQGTGILIKTESFNKLGQWDTSLFLWQDIDLFLRAFIQGYKYKKFFNLPPDLHIRRLETSLSRGNFFDIKKQVSRILVVKNAVKLLKEHNQQQYLPEAKYMVGEIASGLIRSYRFDHAEELIIWAHNEGVLTSKEYSLLQRLKYIYKLRLPRFGIGKKTVQDITKIFSCETTLGKLQYK